MSKNLTSEQLQLNIIINGDNAQKEIYDLEKSIRSYNSENRKMNKELAEIRAKMSALKNAGKDTGEEYQELANKARLLNQSMDANKRSTKMAADEMERLRKGIEPAKKTISDLNKEITNLRKLRDISTPGTEQWKQYDHQLQSTQDQLNKLTERGKYAKMSLCDMASTTADSIITAYAAFQAFIRPMDKAINRFAQYTDVAADAQKTTGLAADEVDGLSETLEKLDTRTSQDDLMGLVKIAGKLGIEGVDNIEGFVRAADKIAVALNEDLGGDVEESINQVGKIVDIFKLKDELGVEQSLLKVGSTINDLGASSSANEGYIVDFTNRVAGIAPMAGISVQNVMGLAATLDQFGQRSEESSTVFSGVMAKMYKDTDTFARLAGMDVRSFTRLLNEDANEAFLRLVENLKGNTSGISSLVENLGDMALEGKKAIGVLGTLADHTDTLRQQQALANASFEKGTSLTNEFGIKNNTAQASIDKNKKVIDSLTRSLGKELAPAYSLVLSSSTGFLRLLMPMATFMGRNALAFTVASVAIGVWTVAVNWATIANSKFITSLVRMFKFMVTNPIWAVIAALSFLAVKAVEVVLKTDSVAKAMNRVAKASKDASRDMETERAKLDQLFGVLKGAKKGTEQYELAKKAIIDQYGDYLSGLSAEKRTLEDVEGAQRALTDAIIASARAKAMSNAMSDAQARYGEKAGDIYKRMQDDLISKLGNDKGMNLFTRLREGLEAGKPLAKDVLAELYALKEGYGGIWSEIDHIKNAKKMLKVETDAIAAALGKTQTEIAAEQAATANRLAEQERRQREERGRQREEERRQTSDDLKKKQEDEKKAREDYIQSLVDQAKTENQLYDDRLKKAGIFGKKRNDLTGDQLIAFDQLAKDHAENLKKIEDDKIKALEERDKAYTDALTESLKDRFDLLLNRQAAENTALSIELADMLQKRQDSDDEQLRALRKMHAQELAAFTGSGAERARLILSQQAEELAMDQKHYSEQEKMRDGNQARQREQTAAHLREMITEIEDFFKYGFTLSLTDYITLDELTPDQLADLRAKLAAMKQQLLDSTGTGKDPKTPEVARSNVDILGMSREEWTGFFKNLESGKLGIEDLQQAAKALHQVWGTYNEYMNAADSKRLKKYERSTENEKRILKEKLDSGIIEQRDYDNQVAALDENLDKKKDAIERKQAERAKALAIFDAAINTAVAVTEALKVPPPFGFALAAIVAGMGGAEIAAIAAQQYAEGRYPVMGKDDKKVYDAEFVGSVGTGIYSKPSLGLFSETSPELVVDGATTRKLVFDYPQIYRSIMNIARGGVPQFATGRYPETYDTTSTMAANVPSDGYDPEMKRIMIELTSTMKSLQNMELFVSMFGKNGLYPSIKKAERYLQKIKK